MTRVTGPLTRRVNCALSVVFQWVFRAPYGGVHMNPRFWGLRRPADGSFFIWWPDPEVWDRCDALWLFNSFEEADLEASRQNGLCGSRQFEAAPATGHQWTP